MTAAVLEAPAPAAAAPPEPFAFGLDESREAARKLLAHFSGRPMAHFDRVWDNYLEKKGALVGLVDPSTGRREVDLRPSGKVTPAQKHEALVGALSPMGLHAFANCLVAASVEADAVSADDAARLRAGCPGLEVAAGTKVSRALHKFLLWKGRTGYYGVTGLANVFRRWGYAAGNELLARWGANLAKKKAAARDPTDEELAPMVVAEASERYAARSKPMRGALTANGLDVLTTSYLVPFASCLRPDGDYRAGPQQYLGDGHTLLFYAWRGTKEDPATGLRLPYKLYREAVHVDLEVGVAQFMLPYYSDRLDPDDHKEARKAVALLVAKHKGLDCSAPGWYEKHFEDRECPSYPYDLCPPGGRRLASIDQPHGCRRVLLKGAGGPKLALAWPLPCGNCEKGTLHRPGSLVCADCQ